MGTPHEFHYRLPQRSGGWSPGSHRGTTLGPGLDFVSHMRLVDRPDPRRLDLRASLRHLGGDWLVRTSRQHVGLTVHAVVDVSASMRFGTPRTKLGVAADFVDALGLSAWRVGDAVGLLAFDAGVRDDLFMPARHGRGTGRAMAELIERSAGGSGGIEGLEEAAMRLAGRRGLVFVVSDFHWAFDRLGAVLDLLTRAQVVPLIVWDPSEMEPPAHDAIARLEDAESGRRRTVWLRPALRTAWRAAAAERRAALAAAFAARGNRPIFVAGAFHGEVLTKYFLEGAT